MKKTIFEKGTVKREAPRNFNPADNHIFKRYWISNTPECHLIFLKNIFIVNKTVLAPYKLKIFGYYSHVNGVSILGKLKTIFHWMTKRKRVVEKAVWIHDNYSNNYYHWLTECLPRYLFAEKELNGHLVMIPEKFRGYRFITESLDLMQIRFDFFNEGESVSVQDLVLTSRIGRVAEYRPELLFKLRARLNIADAIYKKPGRMIYIKRKPAKARNIYNASDVEQVMTEFGVECHDFEKYAFTEQMQLMADTVFLVSIHGAGLTNMLFMPLNGYILEFRNEFDEGYSPNCYFNLSGDLGMNYYYTTNKGTAPKTNQADYEIDLVKLRTALEEITSELQSRGLLAKISQ